MWLQVVCSRYDTLDWLGDLHGIGLLSAPATSPSSGQTAREMGSSGSVTIRVVSWNIHKAIGGIDRLYRPERVVALLREINPDIALLQEVSDSMPRSTYHAQAEMLSAALNLRHFVYAPEHRYRQGGYGNAILSRWPLTDVERTDLTIGRKKKRGALTVHTRPRTADHSRTLVVSNFHLGLAGSERAQQLQRFFQSKPFAHVATRTPIIIAGDLNDLWGTLGPKFMQPNGFARAGSLVNTFPAWLPLRPLDGIFVSGQADVLRAGVRHSRLARIASDHLPIVADFRLHSARTERHPQNEK